MYYAPSALTNSATSRLSGWTGAVRPRHETKRWLQTRLIGTSYTRCVEHLVPNYNELQPRGPCMGTGRLLSPFVKKSGHSTPNRIADKTIIRLKSSFSDTG